MERAFKTIKMSEKNGRWSKVVLFPEKNKIEILVFLMVASTVGECTGTSSTHDVPAVEVDDDGALSIPPRSLPGEEDISGS